MKSNARELPEPSGAGSELERVRRELRDLKDQFRSIIHRTADGILVVAADGVVHFANAAAGELFGREPHALLGSHFGHPMVVGEATEIELRRGGELAVAELRVMETEWEGEPARIVSLRDITDRKKAEQRERELVREQMARVEAEEAARRAEFLAEAAERLSGSLALETTLQSAIQLVVEELADYCVLDLLEEGEVRRYAAARGPDREAVVAEARRQTLRIDGDTPQARVFREREAVLVRRVDDEWLRSAAQTDDHLALLRSLDPREVILVPIFAGRECLGVLTAFATRETRRFRERDLHLAMDLGRHAALAIENARLYRDVEAANHAKTNFLSVMSHELRTPLSAIIGYTDLIDRGVVGETTEKQGQYLGRIRASSSHLLQIIEEILAFAGMEGGKESVQARRTTLAEIVEGVVGVAESLSRETGLELRVRVEDERAELWTDERKVRQILLNLLSNAFKFTDDGWVEVRARVEGDEAVFEVADTGVGIPTNRQGSIFERFWQAEDALTRKAGGTGLGLTVARSFTELLGGSLDVDSESGAGSTFTLRIPRNGVA